MPQSTIPPGFTNDPQTNLSYRMEHCVDRDGNGVDVILWYNPQTNRLYDDRQNALEGKNPLLPPAEENSAGRTEAAPGCDAEPPIRRRTLLQRLFPSPLVRMLCFLAVVVGYFYPTLSNAAQWALKDPLTDAAFRVETGGFPIGYFKLEDHYGKRMRMVYAEDGERMRTVRVEEAIRTCDFVIDEDYVGEYAAKAVYREEYGSPDDPEKYRYMGSYTIYVVSNDELIIELDDAMRQYQEKRNLDSPEGTYYRWNLRKPQREYLPE